MYSALCPKCGAALYGATGGLLLVNCSGCQWSGKVMFHFLPGKINFNPYGGGPLGFQPLPPMPPGMGSLSSGNTAPLGPDEAEADPLEARRAALGQRLYAAASAVAEMLRTVDTEQWQYPAWRDYERLQEAHAALYVALGGARMGEYHPTRAKLDEALGALLFWALLTLDAVEG